MRACAQVRKYIVYKYIHMHTYTYTHAFSVVSLANQRLLDFTYINICIVHIHMHTYTYIQAFSVVSLANQRLLDLDPAKVDIGGMFVCMPLCMYM